MVGLTWNMLTGYPIAVSRPMRVELVAIAFATGPACPCSICGALVASLFDAREPEIIGNGCCPARPAYWPDLLRFTDMQTGSGVAQPRATARFCCAILNSLTKPF